MGSMNFYLGVWSGESVPFGLDARTWYAALVEGRAAATGFHAGVYGFHQELTRRYPDVDMVAEEDLDACPWACALDVSDHHVLMALLPDRYPGMLPLVLHLADRHGLVCFDPQNSQVHLPSHLLKS